MADLLRLFISGDRLGNECHSTNHWLPVTSASSFPDHSDTPPKPTALRTHQAATARRKVCHLPDKEFYALAFPLTLPIPPLSTSELQQSISKPHPFVLGAQFVAHLESSPNAPPTNVHSFRSFHGQFRNADRQRRIGSGAAAVVCESHRSAVSCLTVT